MAVGVTTNFLKITWLVFACTVLAPDQVGGNGIFGYGLQGLEHFYFFVSDAVGLQL